MNKWTHVALLGLAIAFTGCEQANEAAKEAAKEVTAGGEKALEGVKDLANIDFGDFDMKGLQEKFSGIVKGFEGLTADNVGGLTSKISDLSGSIGDMGISNLPDVAKGAVNKAIQGFIASVKKAMDGITDDSILAKLKPVVESLMQKLDGLK